MNSNNYDLEKNKILKLFKDKKFNKLIKLGKKLLKKNSQDYELLYTLSFSCINLHNYILVNKLMLEKILFVGYQSEIAKKMINNLNVSRKLKQHPDSRGVGKLASHLISNNISINKTTFAFEKFKPVYVRSAKINKK